MPTAMRWSVRPAPLIFFLEEVLRDLDVDAGTVAGLAVGVDRTAVPDRLQRLDALEHHLAPRLAVDRHDAADAAGVALERRDRRAPAAVAARARFACVGGHELGTALWESGSSRALLTMRGPAPGARPPVRSR